MTIRKRILFIHLIWSMMIPKLIHSQAIDSRKTEEDVKIEDQFIAAKLLVTSGKKTRSYKTARFSQASHAAKCFHTL